MKLWHNFKRKGKLIDLSVLFVDIRNFTSISDILNPEEVSRFLNEYFEEIIPTIYKNKGIVNKFIGDELLVVFGAPKENPKHAEYAVKCALEIIEKIKKNKSDIEIGIGVSTGIAFVGNIGSAQRYEYSTVGNTVNTASRLESFNKLYKTNILISEDTYQRVKSIIEAEEVDSVCIAENSEPIKIYELKSLKNV